MTYLAESDVWYVADCGMQVATGWNYALLRQRGSLRSCGQP